MERSGTMSLQGKGMFKVFLSAVQDPPGQQDVQILYKILPIRRCTESCKSVEALNWTEACLKCCDRCTCFSAA
eukprot:498476-Pelagomonas_calceolata.AAC.7